MIKSGTGHSRLVVPAPQAIKAAPQALIKGEPEVLLRKCVGIQMRPTVLSESKRGAEEPP